MHGTDLVSLVAFIVSIVALLLAGLQFTQSTLLTADGSRKLKAAVIGKWEKLVYRHLIWAELQAEMIFTTPRIILIDFDEADQFKTFDPADLSKDDGLQLIHKRNASLYPRTRALHAAAHILGYNSLPLNFEERWRRNQQADIAPSSSGWSHLWNRLVAHRIVRFVLDYVSNDHLDVGLGKDIGISWDRLLRQIYLCQSFTLELERSALVAPEAVVVPSNDLEKGVELVSKEAAAPAGTVAAIELERHVWELLPPEVVRPLARADLGSILILVQRLGMRWREIDTYRGYLRAEGVGSSISSNFISGFGIVLQLNRSKQLRHKLLINNRHVDKIMCGIIPGCAELDLGDIEILPDNSRETKVPNMEFLKKLRLDKSVIEARGFRPYWSQSLVNDLWTLYSPFLPSQRSPITRTPNPFGWDLAGCVGCFETAESTYLLWLKLKDRHEELQRTRPDQELPTTLARNLMATLTSPLLMADFCHTRDAKRHRDLFVPDPAAPSIDEARDRKNVDTLVTHKLEVLHELRQVYDKTTIHFVDLKSKDHGRLDYIDLVKAHMQMHANSVYNCTDVKPEIVKSIRERFAGENFPHGLGAVGAPVASHANFFHPDKIRKLFRDGGKYPEGRLSDNVLEEAWWMLIVRGISWRMSVETAGEGYLTTAPASLYKSEMPIWLT